MASPIVACPYILINNSKRWITRLVRRWRAQPTAWINVNCRTPWTSTSWTHIAAMVFHGHAWPRVGLEYYRQAIISTFGGHESFTVNISYIFIGNSWKWNVYERRHAQFLLYLCVTICTYICTSCERVPNLLVTTVCDFISVPSTHCLLIHIII